jgi:phosphoribosylaminoimidazolecarboxamide formyltransferase/IMP cyclohydrolase
MQDKDLLKIKTAVISVSDKTGAADFAEFLAKKGVKIYSTGGTAKHLEAAGVKIKPIRELTGNEKDDYFSGRMKTISFNYESALLFDRFNPEHAKQAKELGVTPVDLVVCNLYPFEKAVGGPSVSVEKAVEEIDVGGPCMVRAAAKNYAGVAVVVNPARYAEIMAEMDANSGAVSLETRKRLMVEAFSRTADYDAAIHAFFAARHTDEKVKRLAYFQGEKLGRYAENWHQVGWIYRSAAAVEPDVPHAVQVHGGPLGYNNYTDAEAALRSALELSGKPAVSVVKHGNPCGYATGATLAEAFERAWQGDPVSAFGSVIALTEPMNMDVTRLVKDRFIEVILAPKIEKDALDYIKGLTSKKNLRLLEFGHIESAAPEKTAFRILPGGLLEQDRDDKYFLCADALELFAPGRKMECSNSGKELTVGVVTKVRPPRKRAGLYEFALKYVKHVKSNAIVIAREYAHERYQALGMGCGQPNRKDSVRLAAERARANLALEFESLGMKGLDADEYARKELAGDHVVLASDAFFPFRDGVDDAADTGVRYIVAPGGSVKDDEVIKAADECGIGMIFTGVRKFCH